MKGYELIQKHAHGIEKAGAQWWVDTLGIAIKNLNQGEGKTDFFTEIGDQIRKLAAKLPE